MGVLHVIRFFGIYIKYQGIVYQGFGKGGNCTLLTTFILYIGCWTINEIYTRIITVI
jgi:hypothetical protein